MSREMICDDDGDDDDNESDEPEHQATSGVSRAFARIRTTTARINMIQITPMSRHETIISFGMTIPAPTWWMFIRATTETASSLSATR